MKTKRWIIVAALVIGAVWVTAWSLNHHVIRTSKGTVVLEKRFLSFHNTYVDTRAWSHKQFKVHPAIKDALICNGYGDVVTAALKADIRKSFAHLADRIELKCEKIKIAALERFAGWLDSIENYWFPEKA